LVALFADQLVGLVLARRKERQSAQSTQSKVSSLPTEASA
jgi:hypothetical protein